MTSNTKITKTVKTESNIEFSDYPYSAVIHYSALKAGMMILDGDVWEEDDPIYFMFKIQEISCKKTTIDGKETNCFIPHMIAYSKDGREIYNLYKEVSIEPTFYDELTERVYFKTIEEAKAFGIDESQLETSDFEWYLKNR